MDQLGAATDARRWERIMTETVAYEETVSNGEVLRVVVRDVIIDETVWCASYGGLGLRCKSIERVMYSFRT